MAYIVGQYNKSSSTNSMTILKNGEANRIPSSAAGGTGFPEECLVYTGVFSSETTYYFHCQIKRLTDSQTFNIQLMNNNDFAETQLIKNITIDGGAEGWVDVEFLFTPIKDFNKIGFILNRVATDFYPDQTRYPVIIYQELDKVNNLLASISNNTPLVKIGIQSSAGLITCINGEEIRLGKTGIYEFKNGLLKVNFFSVISAGSLNVDVDSIKADIDARYDSTDLKNQSLSRCLFNNVSSRDLTDFSLDYVYEEG